MDSRQAIMDAEAQTFTGKPVIFVPNEWDRLVVGMLETISTSQFSPICTVFDYVRKEMRTFIGFPFDYTIQRLTALTRLDPYQRTSIVYGRAYGDTTIDKPHLTDWQFSPDDEIQTLRRNGFFTHLRELGYGPEFVMTFGHDGKFD